MGALAAIKIWGFHCWVGGRGFGRPELSLPHSSERVCWGSVAKLTSFVRTQHGVAVRTWSRLLILEDRTGHQVSMLRDKRFADECKGIGCQIRDEGRCGGHE